MAREKTPPRQRKAGCREMTILDAAELPLLEIAVRLLTEKLPEPIALQLGAEKFFMNEESRRTFAMGIMFASQHDKSAK